MPPSLRLIERIQNAEKVLLEAAITADDTDILESEGEASNDYQIHPKLQAGSIHTQQSGPEQKQNAEDQNTNS